MSRMGSTLRQPVRQGPPLTGPAGVRLLIGWCRGVLSLPKLAIDATLIGQDAFKLRIVLPAPAKTLQAAVAAIPKAAAGSREFLHQQTIQADTALPRAAA